MNRAFLKVRRRCFEDGGVEASCERGDPAVGQNLPHRVVGCGMRIVQIQIPASAAISGSNTKDM
jgi:hypothetical protein